MNLAVMPPVSPMLAKPTKVLPTAGDWQYDPKWDGFRCIVFRDGDEVELGSRNTKSLLRYFPEIVQPILEALPPRCVLDGELVVATDAGLDFDALQQRIHPADSRVRMLAAATPASYVAFDILCMGDDDLRTTPLAERRKVLEDALGHAPRRVPGVFLSPCTPDAEVAADWFVRFEGAGLDGVIAKDRGGTYREGERGWAKIKHSRTADCVVGGFRKHKHDGVGSLLLGLYDDEGRLHHVGVASSFTAKRRGELVEELAPYVLGVGEGHPWDWAAGMTGGERSTDGDLTGWDGTRMPGGVSRWTGDRDLSFVPLRPELVCEVVYDQLQGPRFRHAARFLRWRPDRDPDSCRYDQLETPTPSELAEVFGT